MPPPLVLPRDSIGHIASNFLLTKDSERPDFRWSQQRTDEDSFQPTIAIIGGGFIGLSAAMRLGELNRIYGHHFDVVLLEQGHIACGPTGKSAGHVCGLQSRDERVLKHCGETLGRRLIEHAHTAANLVRELAARFGSSCAMLDGYVTLKPDGKQVVSRGTDEFSIASYPYALAMAHAAAIEGVAIFEHTPVRTLDEHVKGYILATPAASFRADYVIACAGTRMGFDIPLLAPLCAFTTELRVGTIITEPIPSDVLLRVFPAADGKNFAFADEAVDVAYGTIDAARRIIFGACSAAVGKICYEKIAERLCDLLPGLFPACHVALGRRLQWQPFVTDEALSFTRDELPNVGILCGHPRVLYAHGLGGHGIALGTLLGHAIAEKVWNSEENLSQVSIFDDFAAVRHKYLPISQPWRILAASIGLQFSQILH